MSRIEDTVGQACQPFLSWTLASTLVLALACNPSGDHKEMNDGAPAQRSETPSQTVSAEVAQPAASEHIKGRIGSSTQWDSGWIDLDVVTSFKRGDKLRLRVGGSANSILLRFLEKGDSPDDATGFDGGVINVPEDRVVQVILEEDHDDVVQISVHGGPNPWNLYPMGGDNGPATILSVERITS